jgi:hypothetical protein
MLRPFLAVLTVGLFSASAWAQSACDLNDSGAIDVVDVQLSVNMRLGLLPCTATIYGAVCNDIVVQRLVNAALGGTCVTGTGVTHRVLLSWTPSTSANVTGYNIYRGTTSGGAYAKVNSAPVVGVTYTDTTVQSGETYYYVATAIDNSNNESVYSNQAQAAVPIP